MATLAFLKNLAGVKTQDAVSGLMTALANADPQAMGKADLATMEQALDKLGRDIASARGQFDKAEVAAKAAQGLYDQRLHAAEIVSQQAENETDEARKAQLNKSLETLITKLEDSKHEVESAIANSKGAKQFLDDLSTRYKQLGEQLKSHKENLEKSQRSLEQARLERTQAEERAQVSREAAGLASTTTGISVALKAIQDAAEKEHQAAEAANAKADLLRPSNPETEDPVIAAALAQASGKPAPASLNDRLAALRTKAA